MIRYKQGLRRYASRAGSLARWRLTQAMGAMQGWPVYRPPVDHSVYEMDNRLLPSTSLKRARIVHQVSITTLPELPAVVEYEHGTALVGHLGYGIDYRRFRDELQEKWTALLRWYDPQRHRLVATSEGALASALALTERCNLKLETDALRVLRWAVPQRATRLESSEGQLRVFHYGGAYPYAKGTHEVLRAARLLPQVHFDVCTDPTHRLFASLPANVRLIPHLKREEYLAAIDKAQVLANPIFSDGWGVMLDATARAIPIVSYNTFDKAEAVEDGRTGVLIEVPRELSWYDGFFENHWHSWSEFNDFLASSTPASTSEALAAEIARYDEDRERLRQHSQATAAFHARRHDPQRRFAAMLNIYSELLSALPSSS